MLPEGEAFRREVETLRNEPLLGRRLSRADYDNMIEERDREVAGSESGVQLGRPLGTEVPRGGPDMVSVKNPWVELILFILASPILLFLALQRAYQRYWFFRLAMEPRIACECGAIVALVGLWRCSCGFTYTGHLLRLCPVCESLPCVVRCYQCGVTTKLPEP